jgi:flagellar protein FlbD
VILLHRLRGEPMYLNADLIEVVEATPDTVVTLADGRKIVVSETPAEVIDRARLFRASVLATSEELRENRRSGAPVLSILPTDRGGRG